MRTTAFAAIAACLLAVTACGGDDDSSGSDTTAPATAAESDTTEAPAGTTEPGADATTEAPADTDAPEETEAPATDAPDAPEGALDVCSLLTTADLEAAFGGTWDAGTPTHQEQTGGDQCVWGNLDVPPVKTFSATIYREGSLNEDWEDAGLTVGSLFADTKTYATVDEELELGDEAYRAGTTIAVLDGGTSYSFDTFLGTSDEAIAGLRKLAEQIVTAGI